MKPRVTLRKALEDPELLGSALAGATWHAWRALVAGSHGEVSAHPSLGAKWDCEQGTQIDGRART